MPHLPLNLSSTPRSAYSESSPRFASQTLRPYFGNSEKPADSSKITNPDGDSVEINQKTTPKKEATGSEQTSSDKGTESVKKAESGDKATEPKTGATEKQQAENIEASKETGPTEEVESEDIKSEEAKADKKEKATEPKKKMGFFSIVKSLAVTVAGVALIALPIVLFPITGVVGVFALTKVLLSSIPFIVAKDMMDDYVKKNHDDVTNVSDFKVLREVLDEKMKGILESVSSLAFWAGEEKKASWVKGLMGVYEGHISKFLDSMGGDLHFSALFKEMPEKLREKDGMFGKGEVIISTVLMVLKLALLTTGRQRLVKGAGRGGFWGGAIGLVLLAYNMLFEKQANQFEAELDKAAKNRANAEADNKADSKTNKPE